MALLIGGTVRCCSVLSIVVGCRWLFLIAVTAAADVDIVADSRCCGAAVAVTASVVDCCG